MRVSRKKTRRSDRRSPLEEPASKGERKPGIGRTTVHRTIEKLMKLGLADELDLTSISGGKHCYETKPGLGRVHLACLKQDITSRSGFENRDIRIEAGCGSTLWRGGQARQEGAWRKERIAPQR